MAERRMFSKWVISGDAFLDMPNITQLFYFHLSMAADDDGFVDCTRLTMRSVGAKRRDMDTLIEKKFIIYFSEESVSVIRHWNVSNSIRPDRYKETKYKKLKDRLSLDEDVYVLKQEGGDTGAEPRPNGGQAAANGCQAVANGGQAVANGCQMDTNGCQADTIGCQMATNGCQADTNGCQADTNGCQMAPLGEDRLGLNKDNLREDQKRGREESLSGGFSSAAESKQRLGDLTARVEGRRKKWEGRGLPPAPAITNTGVLNDLKDGFDTYPDEKLDEAIENFAGVVFQPGFDPSVLPGGVGPPNFKNFLLRWVDRFIDEASPFERYKPKTKGTAGAWDGPDWGGAVDMGKGVKARPFFGGGDEWAEDR